MQFKGSSLFSLFLIAVGSYAVLSAFSWSLKAALFPIATGVPLIILAAVQLIVELFGTAKADRGPAVDLEFSAEVAPEVARCRTIAIFAWIAGFILVVILLGLPIAVPLFIFSYLSLQSRVGLWLSIVLTAAAWGLFYGLFQWLLHLPFEAGLVQSWLGL